MWVMILESIDMERLFSSPWSTSWKPTIPPSIMDISTATFLSLRRYRMFYIRSAGWEKKEFSTIKYEMYFLVILQVLITGKRYNRGEAIPLNASIITTHSVMKNSTWSREYSYYSWRNHSLWSSLFEHCLCIYWTGKQMNLGLLPLSFYYL